MSSDITKSSFKQDLLKILPSLRAFAMSLCGRHDKADDLVQDTVVKALSKRDLFRPDTNLKAWVFTILRNEYFSQLRKKGREVEDPDGALGETLAILPAQSSNLDLQDFQAALERLPEDQKEALLLVGASGFSYEEAGEICGAAPGTIKSRVSRARARLNEVLETKGEAPTRPDPQHLVGSMSQAQAS